MRNHTVELSDKAGKSCKIRISTPSAGTKIWHGITSDMLDEGPKTGDWRTLDKGFIRYDSGETYSYKSDNEEYTTRDCYLLSIGGIELRHFYGKEHGKYGIKLFEYEDWNGVNNDGEGFVIQQWVLSFTVGRITWAVID